MCVLNEQGPLDHNSRDNGKSNGASRNDASTPNALRLVRSEGDAPLRSPGYQPGTPRISPSAARPWKSSHPPSAEEIALAINPDKFPAILTPEQAAELLQIAPNTLYKHVSQGKYKQAVRRGNPLRFWRDRLIQAFFAA